MSECAPGDPVVTITIAWGNGDADHRLVLDPDCPDDGVGLWWSTFAFPVFLNRQSFAPPSAWSPGQVLLATVRDTGTLNMTVGASGTTTATLQAQKAILEAALDQWPYTVTISVDDPGAAPPVLYGPYVGFPTVPSWPNPVTPQDAALYADEATVVIQLNPAGSP